MVQLHESYMMVTCKGSVIFLCSIETEDAMRKFCLVLNTKFHENSSAGSNAVPY